MVCQIDYCHQGCVIDTRWSLSFPSFQMTQWDRKVTTCRVYLKRVRPLFTADRPASPLNKETHDEIVGRWDTGSDRSAFWKLSGRSSSRWATFSLVPSFHSAAFQLTRLGTKVAPLQNAKNMWHQVWWTWACVRCDTRTIHVHLSAFRMSDRADRLQVHSRVFIGPHFSWRRALGNDYGRAQGHATVHYVGLMCYINTLYTWN